MHIHIYIKHCIFYKNSLILISLFLNNKNIEKLYKNELKEIKNDSDGNYCNKIIFFN